MLARLRAAHRRRRSPRGSRRASTRRPTRSPDGWLAASSWYQQFVLPAGTVVTKEVLDGLRTQRPSSSPPATGTRRSPTRAALALAGITAATPDPAGGRIEHAPDGRAERPAPGRRAAPRHVAAPAARRATRSTRRGAACSASRARASRRSTCPASSARPTIAAFAKLRKAGGLTARAHFAIGPFGPARTTVASLSRDRRPAAQALRDAAAARRARLAARPAARPAARRASRASRSTASSSCSTASCRRRRRPPRCSSPTSWTGSRGRAAASSTSTTRSWAGSADFERRGYQSHVHAIGDRAVRVTLDAAQAMRKADGMRDSRPRSPTPSSWPSPTSAASPTCACSP